MDTLTLECEVCHQSADEESMNHLEILCEQPGNSMGLIGEVFIACPRCYSVWRDSFARDEDTVGRLVLETGHVLTWVETVDGSECLFWCPVTDALREEVLVAGHADIDYRLRKDANGEWYACTVDE